MEGYIFYARALEALMGRESLQLPMGTNRSRLLGFNGGAKNGVWCYENRFRDDNGGSHFQ